MPADPVTSPETAVAQKRPSLAASAYWTSVASAIGLMLYLGWLA